MNAKKKNNNKDLRDKLAELECLHIAERLARTSSLQQSVQKCHVRFSQQVPDRRVRDLDNRTTKWFIDPLVQVGLLKEDKEAVIQNLNHQRSEIAPGEEPWIQIEIEEIE